MKIFNFSWKSAWYIKPDLLIFVTLAEWNVLRYYLNNQFSRSRHFLRNKEIEFPTESYILFTENFLWKSDFANNSIYSDIWGSSSQIVRLKAGVRFNLATLDSIRKLFPPLVPGSPTKKYISFIFRCQRTLVTSDNWQGGFSDAKFHLVGWGGLVAYKGENWAACFMGHVICSVHRLQGSKTS